MKDFKDVQALADDIKSAYSARNTLYDLVEQAYLLKEVDLPDQDWVKPTLSTDARNKVLGAVRLLTAADPKWSVPRDKNKAQMKEELASKVEKAADMIWSAAGKIKGKSIHYTGTMAGVLYGQVDIAIIPISEMIGREKNPMRKARLEKIAKRTPLMFEVINPKLCYPVYDVLGLSKHYTLRKMKVVDVIARFGDIAQKQLLGKKLNEEVDYSEYWDEEEHCVWIQGQKDPLMQEDHGLPFIPIASAIVEGGDLFEDEFKWQPFLYTLVKSQIHSRQSLMLTLMFSNAFSTGAMPKTVYETDDPTKDLEIDYNTVGGVIKINRGEKLGPLVRETIDKSMYDLTTMAQQKAEESTIYSQTLGEPLGSNAPYSMVALLSQSGRLPLVPYQRMLSTVITDAMQKGLEMLRTLGTKQFKVGSEAVGIDLDLDEVPEDLELVAKLDIDLPQDEFTQARVANDLVGSGLVSKERARDRYLNIPQSDEEEKQILREKYMEFVYQMQLQQKAQEMQAQMMGANPAAAPGGAPAGPGMDPNMMDPNMMDPNMMPPEMNPADQMGANPGVIPGGMPMQAPMMPPGMNPESQLPPDMSGGM